MHQLSSAAVDAGDLECDAYLITGSRDSVYYDAPWIIELVNFVERAMAAGKKS